MTFPLFISEAKKLPILTRQQVLQFRGMRSELTAFVDEQLSIRKDISALIGNNPLQIMFDNHKHHVAFMDTVFVVGDYGLLAKTLPWVYHSYHAQHFSYDSFPAELNAWSESTSR